MKRILLAVAVAAMAVGCSDSKNASVEAEVSSSKGVDVDYSFKDKDKYVSKLKGELKEINNQIENAAREVRAEAKPQLEKLKEKARNLDVEISKAENATEATWNDIKAGSKKAFDDIKDGFRDARDWTAEKLK